MMLFIRLFLISLISLVFNAQASDLAKEKRWANQVADAILDGEPVWLNDGKSEFLGIYTEAEENKDRAVIIMHGTGVHPDWQQVVQPLRTGLTGHNWSTLSIQMPILTNEADYKDYAPLYDEVAPRIDAAIKYLRQQGTKKIVLIGHSQGAVMSAWYLSTTKQKLQGFVAIGMSSWSFDPRMNSISAVEKMKLPLLDLYGSDDLDTVISSLKPRADAAKTAGNTQFSQLKINGNHFFDGEETSLIKTVADWLDKNIK